MKKLLSILRVLALLTLGFALAEDGRVTAQGMGQGIDGEIGRAHV